MADESKTQGVPWRIPQPTDVQGDAGVAQDNPNDRWQVTAVSHETRKELVKGTDQVQDIPITVALMSRLSDGEMKTWEARGKWTLAQMQAMPEAK